MILGHAIRGSYMSEEKADLKYETTAFVLKNPLGGIVGHYKCNDKKQLNTLREYAKKKKLYLYFADIVVIDGKECISSLMAVDWNTVPELSESKPESTVKLTCKTCKISFKSKSGFTLHMKSKH